jgi:hypothetical protein
MKALRESVTAFPVILSARGPWSLQRGQSR